MMICRLTGVSMKRDECVLVREARAVHAKVTTDPVGVSRTQQADKDQTDINNIVNRYARTGNLPPQRQGVYADVTALQGELTELHERSKAALQTFDEFERQHKAKAAEAAKAKAAEAAKVAADQGKSKDGLPAS